MGLTALHFAAIGDVRQMKQVLFEKCPTKVCYFMEMYHNELELAAVSATISLVHLLLQWGADVELAGTMHGTTVLHYAIRYGAPIAIVHAYSQTLMIALRLHIHRHHHA